MAGRKRIWLGICEPQNANISKVRNLMYAAVPRGTEMAFVVPLVSRAVASYWTKQFSMLKPGAILLNDDEALFGSFENYNVFLQCCLYVANMPLERLYVLNPHYEKKIYRDSDFEWYTPMTVWERDLRIQEKDAELRAEAERNLREREEARQREREEELRVVEELKCLKSMH